MINTKSKSNLVTKQCNHLREQLNNHPLYTSIDNTESLRVFMEHHVFAVWDFMSLVKSIQNHLAPSTVPWIPSDNSRFVKFINQLVLEEESDNAYSDKAFNRPASHFEVYLQSMTEIGANTYFISRFINAVRDTGLDTALKIPNIPEPAQQFMKFTFDVIKCNQPHLLATILAWGREDLVPQLFQSLRQTLQLNKCVAPHLFSYLDRHIQLDEQEHAPIAIQLVQELCKGSITKQTESIEIAEQSLAVRLEFWNGIYRALN